MGLDMHLTKEHYVRNWSHYPPEARHTITVEGPVATEINLDRIRTITEEVAYWRKANAIHGWFVNNVQGGEDDCGIYWVGVEQLTELRDLCRKVLSSPKRAAELLPPLQGFSYEVDEWYLKEIQYTEQVLTEALVSPGSADFYYQSSW